MDPFLGEIRLFGFDFVPRGWAPCQGQIMSIQQNTALFALLGTTYGGNGRNTFALPDLRGRVPVGQGQGNGLSHRTHGDQGGQELVTLAEPNLPAHSHSVAASSSASTKDPAGAVPGATAAEATYDARADVHMSAAMIATTGQNLAHENMQPYLALNYCIALEGIFPSRD